MERSGELEHHQLQREGWIHEFKKLPFSRRLYAEAYLPKLRARYTQYRKTEISVAAAMPVTVALQMPLDSEEAARPLTSLGSDALPRVCTSLDDENASDADNEEDYFLDKRTAAVLGKVKELKKETASNPFAQLNQPRAASVEPRGSTASSNQGKMAKSLPSKMIAAALSSPPAPSSAAASERLAIANAKRGSMLGDRLGLDIGPPSAIVEELEMQKLHEIKEAQLMDPKARLQEQFTKLARQRGSDTSPVPKMRREPKPVTVKQQEQSTRVLRLLQTASKGGSNELSEQDLQKINSLKESDVSLHKSNAAMFYQSRFNQVVPGIKSRRPPSVKKVEKPKEINSPFLRKVQNLREERARKCVVVKVEESSSSEEEKPLHIISTACLNISGERPGLTFVLPNTPPALNLASDDESPRKAKKFDLLPFRDELNVEQETEEWLSTLVKLKRTKVAESRVKTHKAYQDKKQEEARLAREAAEAEAIAERKARLAIEKAQYEERQRRSHMALEEEVRDGRRIEVAPGSLLTELEHKRRRSAPQQPSPIVAAAAPPVVKIPPPPAAPVDDSTANKEKDSSEEENCEPVVEAQDSYSVEEEAMAALYHRQVPLNVVRCPKIRGKPTRKNALSSIVREKADLKQPVLSMFPPDGERPFLYNKRSAQDSIQQYYEPRTPVMMSRATSPYKTDSRLMTPLPAPPTPPTISVFAHPSQQALSDSDEDQAVRTTVKLSCMGEDRKAFLAWCDKFKISPVPALFMSGDDRVLDLKNAGLSDELVLCLTAALQFNDSFRTLDLTSCGASQSSLCNLLRALHSQRRLVQLLLSHNELTYSVIEALSALLCLSTSIRHLQLVNITCVDNLMATLGHAMAENCYLTHVDLSRNQLGEVAGSYLAYVVRAHPTLKSLNLSWNNIHGVGACELGTAVASSRSLEVLSLSHNALERFAVFSLSEALTTNSSLKVLDLSHNDVDEQGVLVLMWDLEKHNRTLRRLILNHNPIGLIGGRAVLVTKVERSDTLHITWEGCSFATQVDTLLDRNCPAGKYTLDLSLRYHMVVSQQLREMALSSNQVARAWSSPKYNGLPHRVHLEDWEIPKTGILEVEFSYTPTAYGMFLEGAVIEVEPFTMLADVFMTYVQNKNSNMDIVKPELKLPTISSSRALLLLSLAAEEYFFSLDQVRRLAELLSELGVSKLEVYHTLFCRIVDNRDIWSWIGEDLSVQQVLKLQEVLGPNQFFCARNPTGSYSLDLADPWQRLLFVTLRGISSSDREGRQGRELGNTSQNGHWEGFRNTKFKSTALTTKELLREPLMDGIACLASPTEDGPFTPTNGRRRGAAPSLQAPFLSSPKQPRTANLMSASNLLKALKEDMCKDENADPVLFSMQPSWPCPTSGTLSFDFVSFRRPPQNSKCMKEEDFDALLERITHKKVEEPPRDDNETSEDGASQKGTHAGETPRSQHEDAQESRSRSVSRRPSVFQESRNPSRRPSIFSQDTAAVEQPAPAAKAGFKNLTLLVASKTASTVGKKTVAGFKAAIAKSKANELALHRNEADVLAVMRRAAMTSLFSVTQLLAVLKILTVTKHRVDLVVYMYSRLNNLEGLRAGLLEALNKEEFKLVHHRLGGLTLFDPQCLDGHYSLNLGNYDDREIFQLLRSGPPDAYKNFVGFQFDDNITGGLPFVWRTCKMPAEGAVVFQYKLLMPLSANQRKEWIKRGMLAPVYI